MEDPGDGWDRPGYGSTCEGDCTVNEITHAINAVGV